MDIEQQERVRSLEKFAGVSAGGPMTVPSQSVFPVGQDRVFGAQQVAVHRDDARVLQKLSALGAAAGDDWFYRFPVRNRQKGTTDYIEGPSIKLANDLARIYGNCEVDVRVQDLGESWLIYARFTDYETGYALTRPFQQNKGGARIGGSGGDADARRLDIALQIGVSKAIRNVTVNALQTYADYAFDAAKNSLVEKIGKNLVGYRERTLRGVENLGVELPRVEHLMGKPAKDWNAADVARVIALCKGISDGMSTVDETFPSKDSLPADGKLSQFASDANVDPKTGEVNDGLKVVDKLSDEAIAKHEVANNGASEEQAQGSQTAGKSSPQPSSAAATEDGAEASTASSSANSEPDEPQMSEAEYEAYAIEWFTVATVVEEMRARWAREKSVREKAGVKATTLSKLEGLMKDVIARIKKKGSAES